MKILAIDPGITGALALFENGELQHYFGMPTYKKVTQKKLMQLDLLDGKKQYIKSGPNKGKPKTKVRRAEKSIQVLDVKSIIGFMREVGTVVIEMQNPRPGNSAGSSFTTGVNFGKLLACANLSGAEIITVNPNSWKTDMHITMNINEKKALGNDSKLIKDTLKAKSISLAKKLSGFDFVTPRGAMEHDKAEAVLIGYWYIKNQKETK